MTTRLEIPQDDDFDISRNLQSRKGPQSELAKKVAASATKPPSEDSGAMSIRERVMMQRESDIQVSSTETKHGIDEVKAEESGTVKKEKPSPAPKTNRPANKTRKSKPYHESGNGYSTITMSITSICDKALEFYSNKRNETKSAVFHEAIGKHMDRKYLDIANRMEELKERFAKGDAIEDLVALKSRIEVIPKAKSQQKKFDSPMTRVCFITNDVEKTALSLYSKETGLTQGYITDKALRELIPKEYFKKAEAWITVFGEG